MNRCSLCGSDVNDVIFKAAKISSDGEQKASSGYRITETGGRISRDILRCKGCGLMTLDVDCNYEVILDVYENSRDEEYLTEANNRIKNAKRVLAFLDDLRPGRLLEIGSSAGFLLVVAMEKGYEVFGVEPSKWARDYAKNAFGLDLVKSIEGLGRIRGFFDCIFMVDVIEHLGNPMKDLKVLHGLLKPNGKLIIVTPDAGSLVAKLAGKRWWCLMDSHLFYFTKETLTNMLNECGFGVSKVKSFGRTFSLEYWFCKVLDRDSYPFVFKVLRTFGLHATPVYINLGDQMICVAHRAEHTEDPR